MVFVYKAQRVRKVNFIVTGLKNLSKAYKGLDDRNEITFRDSMLSQELDSLTTKTNIVTKIKTAKINNMVVKETTFLTKEDILIIYVDLDKVQNSIYDNMYKYMLKQICDILKKEKSN